MQISDIANTPTGCLSLTAYDLRGRELWSNRAKNLIVTTGYIAAAQALAGVAGAQIAKIAIGTNGAEPQDTDSSLENVEYIAIQSIEYPQPGQVRFNFTIGYNDVVDMKIREFGLITADGRLFSRKARATIEKTQHMTIVGAWEITM